jgi:hypothetical protein
MQKSVFELLISWKGTFGKKRSLYIYIYIFFFGGLGVGVGAEHSAMSNVEHMEIKECMYH